jgi:hypothetical protein
MSRCRCSTIRVRTSLVSKLRDAPSASGSESCPTLRLVARRSGPCPASHSASLRPTATLVATAASVPDPRLG